MSPDRPLESFGHITATTGTDLVRTQSSGAILGLLPTTYQLDGKNIGIAIFDSGMDAEHKSFRSALLQASRVVVNKDFTGENRTTDNYGHGTHVTSSAAGINPVSGTTYDGVAVNSNIISLRVLNARGTGSTAGVLNAINWILSPVDPTRPVSTTNVLNKDKYNIRVANFSLGAAAIDTYRNDPLCRAARKLVDAGIVVVVAAGNNGKDALGRKIYGQVHSPGNEPSVITVGASNTFGTDRRSDDGITTYSSRGPTRSFSTDANGVKHYDNLIKPDLAAPGNKLIYAEADNNYLVTQNPSLHAVDNSSGTGSGDDRKLMYLSGTSMATPLVSGSAALLLQINPKLTPNMVKMILMYTAQQLTATHVRARCRPTQRRGRRASCQTRPRRLTGLAPNW